jgi:hypothetical protein
VRITRSTKVATVKSPGAAGACQACCTGSIASTAPLMPSTTAKVPRLKPSQRCIAFQLMPAPSWQLEARGLDAGLAGLRLARIRFGQRDADL